VHENSRRHLRRDGVAEIAALVDEVVSESCGIVRR
jgi:hypothetical protein